MTKEELIKTHGQEWYDNLMAKNRAYYHTRKAKDNEWYENRLNLSNQYYQDNKDAISEKNKLAYATNKAAILKCRRHQQKLKYCIKSELPNVENYQEAYKDDFVGWDLHHRLEEQGYTYKELKKQNLYYNRPASELIFLTHAEHTALHENLRKQS